MQRLPKSVLVTELTTVASASTITAGANEKITISACSITNKSASARWVTVTLTPLSGVARNLCFQRVIAIGESYNVSSAIGQTVETGGAVAFAAESNSALDCVVSAYVTNP